MQSFFMLCLLAIVLLASCTTYTPTSTTMQPQEPTPIPTPIQAATSTPQTTPVSTQTSTPSPTINTTPEKTTEPEITLVVTPPGIETGNLKIHYPDFVDEEAAQEQAKILQQAYDFYYNLIGQEYPYNGETIEIIFDSSLGSVSHAGNPIIMGLDSGIWDGKILPPEPAFFHEMVGW